MARPRISALTLLSLAEAQYDAPHIKSLDPQERALTMTASCPTPSSRMTEQVAAALEAGATDDELESIYDCALLLMDNIPDGEESIYPPLSKNARVITYDIRGFGYALGALHRSGRRFRHVLRRHTGAAVCSIVSEARTVDRGVGVDSAVPPRYARARHENQEVRLGVNGAGDADALVPTRDHCQ